MPSLHTILALAASFKPCLMENKSVVKPVPLGMVKKLIRQCFHFGTFIIRSCHKRSGSKKRMINRRYLHIVIGAPTVIIHKVICVTVPISLLIERSADIVIIRTLKYNKTRKSNADSLVSIRVFYPVVLIRDYIRNEGKTNRGIGIKIVAWRTAIKTSVVVREVKR